MAKDGFVKVWRKIEMDDEIWDTSEPYDRRSAFIYLLMEADWKTGILPSKLTIRFLAHEWHWGRDKVHRYIEFLKLVEKLVEVRTKIGQKPDKFQDGKSDKRKIQLKINKWETYQVCWKDESDRKSDKDWMLGKPKAGQNSLESQQTDILKPTEEVKEVKTLVLSKERTVGSKTRTDSQPKASTKQKPKADPSVEQLFKFWGWECEDQLQLTYTASFAQDKRHIKDLLSVVNKNHRIPQDCKVPFLGACMDHYLEAQKEQNGKYLNPSITGFYKRFNAISVELLRGDEPDWGELRKDYEEYLQERQQKGT